MVANPQPRNKPHNKYGNGGFILSFVSEISIFLKKMASKHSVAFAEVLIRAALARRVLVMAIPSFSPRSTRFLHHIFGLGYH
jgi:hypothetical protein